MEYPQISSEIEWGGRKSPPPHTFIQQASKHMFKDDLYGFSRDYLTIQIQQCDYQSTVRAL
jgi:hypothetical protein